jgi:hypothetical protein
LILGPAGRFSLVFLALHRVAQNLRFLGQPLDLRRSSRRTAFLNMDVANGFEVREQLVQERLAARMANPISRMGTWVGWLTGV